MEIGLCMQMGVWMRMDLKCECECEYYNRIISVGVSECMRMYENARGCVCVFFESVL